MKRLALVALFIISAGILMAEPRIVKDGVWYPPRINGYYSESVYFSSVSCADNTAGGQSVIISTFPSNMYAINITSAGTGSPIVQLFDGQISTSGVRALTPPIDARLATTNPPSLWEIGTSSGIAIRNQGGSCVAVIYSPRN